MKQTVLVFISTIIMFGCGHKATSATEDKGNATHEAKRGEPNVDNEDLICLSSHRPISELKPLVVKGDTRAYNELQLAFIEIDNSAILPYAILMANKYGYIQAYYDVYHCLISIYSTDNNDSVKLSKLDSQTREIALDYLRKGAERREHNSLLTLSYLYQEGKYVEKDTVLARQLLEIRKKEMVGDKMSNDAKNDWLINKN